jgi:hypothetical protein
MARFLHIHPLQWPPILQPLLQKEAAPQIPPPTINHHLLLLPLIWTAFSPNSVVRFQKQKQLETDHEAPPMRENWIKREATEDVLVYLPAAGVMTTRPVIIPCTAPMTEGLLNTSTSKLVHISKLVAAHMFVLMTAMEESMLAENGSPPLKPAHPSHRRPAPASMSNTLLGGKRSRSFVNLGPTYKTPHIQTSREHIQLISQLKSSHP